MSLFIDIEVDASVAGRPGAGGQAAEVCPVDIYAQSADGTLEIVEPNLDECVLCRRPAWTRRPPGTPPARPVRGAASRTIWGQRSR